MKKPTHHASTKTHDTPAAHSAHPHGATPHATHPAEAALKSFLQPPTPDSPHTDDTHHSPQPQTVNRKPQTSSPHSPSPWSADLAALETKHHAALTQLATQHQSTLAALETRLAAAEHTTADLSGQVRELR